MSKRVAVNITDEHRALMRVRDLAADEVARLLRKPSRTQRETEWIADVLSAIRDSTEARPKGAI